MSRYRTVPSLLCTTAAAALVLGLSACSHDQADSAEREAFCISFPQRDAGVALRVPLDPQFANDAAAAVPIMRFSADGPSRHTPSELSAPVGIYVGALRSYQPGKDPGADPAVREAVETINAWLRSHCGPVATTR